MNLGKTAKNASVYTVALIIQKVISFVYFSYLAIALGPEKLGIYGYALSIIATAVIFTDLGINNVITREVAANNNKAKQLLKTTVKVKLILSLLTLLGVTIFSLAVEPDLYISLIIIFASLSMIGDTFANTYFASLRGLQKLGAESLMAIISPLISAVIGVAIILTSQDLRLLALSLALGSWLSFFFAYLASNKILVDDHEPVSVKQLSNLVGPFALASVSSKIYGYADTILIRFLSSASQLGFYGLAYKATFALQFIPLAAMAGVYPAMSNANANNDQNRLYYLLTSSLKYVLVLGLPLVAVMLVFGQDIVVTIYGQDFKGAVLPLLILFSSLPMLFSTFPLGAWLNATRRQTANTRNVVIVTIVSIVLNIFVLPKYGAVGAASVSLFSTSLLFVLHLSVIFNFYKHFFSQKTVIDIGKILLIGLVPFLFGWLLKYFDINLFISLAGCFVSYLVTLGLTKILPKQIGERWPKLKVVCQK